jgi:hypothetical protein
MRDYRCTAMTQKPPHRTSRVHLTRDMLLPLPSVRTQALSLEHHLALATVATGYSNADMVARLLKAFYMAFYLRDEALLSDDRVFHHAQAALERCIGRTGQGEIGAMPDEDKAAIGRILLLHDAQLATTPSHRYLAALEKLNRLALMGLKSPILSSHNAGNQPRQTHQ